MKPDDILITKRLILRPVRMTDALLIQRVFPRWHMARYLSQVPWPYPKNGAVKFLRATALPAMKRGADWMWAITLKTGGDELRGIIHLRKGKTNRGFWIAPALQGQGLMTEAVVAVNDFAFQKAGFKKLIISNAKPNYGSTRVKEKTAARLIGRGRERFVAGVLPTEVWELTKEDWEGWSSKK
ncbi:MAG: GNAT family N-acetyltransferase [Proteobacteria bacterium]|nr:GNAT family N-acetyltransferase [Pseudomonadota bacterium]